MEIDAHTLKDLDVFESSTGESSLFQFCNRTRTLGGTRVLRQRMESPFAEAGEIRATQQALAFITANRQAFTRLPAYMNTRTHDYMQDILPIVAQNNLLEFTLGATELRITHNRHYFRIRIGVQVSCGLIRALRQFIAQSELESPAGALAPLFKELRDLLARPRLAKVPDDEIGSWAWMILRLDQVFRHHEMSVINRLVQLVYEIDALVAMADVTADHDFVLPEIASGPLCVHAEGLIHPLVHEAVANPVTLDEERRILFLTGPNMAGKTTYLRAFATAFYLAHLGMGVPASSFRFVPAQRLFSSISLSDDLRSGVSYFRAEALRVKAVAEAIAGGYRTVALMDEPFKGTNFEDALDASLSILKRLATRSDCLFMFSSHLIELSDQLLATRRIECCYFAAQEGEGRLRFDYQLRSGVSSQRLGMRLLHEEGVFDLLEQTVTQ